MTNPYRIEGPALISFSGGRTSGFMLWHILDAYDGQLPENVHVCFANTGKEREETLRFVHECGSRWGVRVRWLEYRAHVAKAPPEARFTEVGYNSAARDGEPFAAVLRRKNYLPNAVARFCTAELKVRVLKAFMVTQGYERWANVIGLRADEMMRVFRAIEANENGKERWTSVMPMATAKARLADVQEFWARQPFDLELRPHEGNCDLCFLKGRATLSRLIRDNPGMADWWSAQEARIATKAGTSGHRFRAEYSYADLVRDVDASPLLPLEAGDSDEFDAECGLWCAGEAA